MHTLQIDLKFNEQEGRSLAQADQTKVRLPLEYKVIYTFTQI